MEHSNLKVLVEHLVCSEHPSGRQSSVAHDWRTLLTLVHYYVPTRQKSLCQLMPASLRRTVISSSFPGPYFRRCLCPSSKRQDIATSTAHAETTCRIRLHPGTLALLHSKIKVTKPAVIVTSNITQLPNRVPDPHSLVNAVTAKDSGL